MAMARVIHGMSGYGGGILTAMLARAVLPEGAQLPALLTVTGLSMLAQSVTDYMKSLSSRFCISKYQSAILINKLLSEHELTLLLPPSYLTLQEIPSLGRLEWLQEKCWRRPSRGEESLFNPVFLPTKTGLEQSKTPLWLPGAPPVKNESLKPLINLWHYFYGLATHTDVDGDSRRMGLVFLRLFDRLIELIEKGKITFFEGHKLAESIRKCMQISFMEDHSAVLFGDSTGASRRYGQDDSYFRALMRRTIPGLPDDLTPLEGMQLASDGLLKAFYDTHPMLVCGEVSDSILEDTRDILTEILLKNHFQLKAGSTLSDFENCRSGDEVLDAIYAAFNTLKHEMIQGPDALMEAILQKTMGLPVGRHMDFLRAISVMGAVDSHALLVKNLCEVCHSGEGLHLVIPVFEQYFLDLKNTFGRLDAMLEDIFSPNKKEGVSVKFYNAFSAFRKHVENLTVSVESFMKNYHLQPLEIQQQGAQNISEKVGGLQDVLASRPDSPVWRSIFQKLSRYIEDRQLSAPGILKVADGKMSMAGSQGFIEHPPEVLGYIFREEDDATFWLEEIVQQARLPGEDIDALKTQAEELTWQVTFLRMADTACLETLSTMDRLLAGLSAEISEDCEMFGLFFADERLQIKTQIASLCRTLIGFEKQNEKAGQYIDQVRTSIVQLLEGDLSDRAERRILRYEECIKAKILARFKMTLQHHSLKKRIIVQEMESLAKKIRVLKGPPAGLLQRIFGSRVRDEDLAYYTTLQNNLQRQKDNEESFCDIARLKSQWPDAETLRQLNRCRLLLEKQGGLLAAQKECLRLRHECRQTLQKGFWGFFWKIRCRFSSLYQQVERQRQSYESALRDNEMAQRRLFLMIFPQKLRPVQRKMPEKRIASSVSLSSVTFISPLSGLGFFETLIKKGIDKQNYAGSREGQGMTIPVPSLSA